MKFPEPKTIRSAMIPTFLAHWVLGMGTIECPIGRPRPVISLCWSFVYFALHLNIVILANKEDPTENALGDVSYNASQVARIIDLIAVTIFLYTGRWKAKDFATCLDKLNSIDKMLSTVGIPNEYGLILKYQMIQLTMVLFLVGITLIYFIRWFGYEAWSKTAAFAAVLCAEYLMMYNHIINCTFATLVRHIGGRFRYLNAHLRQLSSREMKTGPFRQNLNYLFAPLELEIHTNVPSIGVRDKESVAHVMWSTRRIHRELCTIARSLNEAFAIQLLVSMSTSFVLIITLLYNGHVYLNVLTTEYSTFNIWTIVLILNWIIIACSSIPYVAFVCSIASAEAQNIGEVIFELVTPTSSNRVKEEAHSFSLQLVRKPLEFTACGFFVLENGMVRDMISSVTTYLVIMIQLRGTYDVSVNHSTAVPSQALNSTS
ncbi:putative gustatory receptor 28b [Diprion similis]|uniref:putative gustatory receptor 28b n=1 Tax=Diprion similis TaxID=362088 RepID=UPI001EF8AE7B|nr:putative gustatory receptor 28b [Diprion similis]